MFVCYRDHRQNRKPNASRRQQNVARTYFLLLARSIASEGSSPNVCNHFIAITSIESRKMDTVNRISLHGFCRNHDLAKSSVYDRCKEIGIATSDGLSPDDCDRLCREFNVQPVPASEQPDTPVHATVETGNHYLVLSTPQQPQTYSLEGLRQSGLSE